MNWINSVVRPKIRSFLNRRETDENLWVKCPESGEMVFYRELEANDWVVPNSGYHMRMKAKDRLERFFDDKKYELIPLPQVAADPLKFRDSKRYTDRIRDARNKTGNEDSVQVATGTLMGTEIVACVQDFEFMGGSLGMAAGSAIITGMETAIRLKRPFVAFIASGGARMQEGILSLMQLPRTTVAVQRLREAGLPYIVVLTDPTTGGVTASYGMLGDIQIAEPGALIGFAGQRVIEQTIREKLPPGFQKSEYLHAHGMVDLVVHRHKLRETIASLVAIMTHQAAPDFDAEPVRERPEDSAPAALPAPDQETLVADPPVGAHAE